jgi:uncharacterized membrane protein YqjE
MSAQTPRIAAGPQAADDGRSVQRPVTALDRDPDDQSLGELIGRMTTDLSTLVRKEIELAKVEVTEEVKTAGKGAGMFGATAFAGYLALLMLSFALAWGLAELIPVGWAFFCVGIVYAAVAGALLVQGRKQLRAVRGPEQTVETLKEDVAWAREQMR